MAAARPAATVCFLVLALCGLASAGSRTKNGVQLVGGSGGKGRVEVLTTKGYLPFCDISFSDGDAQVMCEMLGHKYGRKYYAPAINYGANETDWPYAIYSCVKNTAGRRLQALRGSALDPTTAINIGSNDKSAAARGSGLDTASTVRRSAALSITPVVSPANAPYSCRVTKGNCASTGPLAGIECADRVFPPAPSPPPSPPAPPPSPPPTSGSIHFIGAATYPNTSPVEPNLCPANAPDFCTRQAGRVELLVSPPSGGGAQVFAPVCAINDTALLNQVAYIACQQALEWPSLMRMPPVIVWPMTPTPSFFAIPTGKVTGAANFNPGNVTAWVTVNGFKAGVDSPRRLQDLDVTITKAKCKSGRLLAMTCTVMEVFWR